MSVNVGLLLVCVAFYARGIPGAPMGQVTQVQQVFNIFNIVTVSSKATVDIANGRVVFDRTGSLVAGPKLSVFDNKQHVIATYDDSECLIRDADQSDTNTATILASLQSSNTLKWNGNTEYYARVSSPTAMLAVSSMPSLPAILKLKCAQLPVRSLQRLSGPSATCPVTHTNWPPKARRGATIQMEYYEYKNGSLVKIVIRCGG